MYIYQEKKEFFAQISDGMEDMGAVELEKLGGYEVVPVFRGIQFKADLKALYRINYCSRLISRIIAPLISFKCYDTDKLYEKSLKINWSDFLTNKMTFAIFGNVSDSKINHSKYASLRLKDAIVDYFKKKYRKRPSVDTNNPDIWFHLHIRNNRAVISVGTSGGSLHRRHYREATGDAPIQETIAASIIKISGWDGVKPLYDPMCGSGTLLAEALMRSSNVPALYLRKNFGFQYLPDFNKEIWKEVKQSADKNIIETKDGIINGSDISGKAIQMSKKNLKNLLYGDKINLQQANFKDLDGIENSIIVCNPPYGIRLKPGLSMEQFYKDFGDFLKQKCTGSEAYIYFGERKYIKNIGLRTSFKKPLKNGGIDGRLVKIELY
jgi:putative N6-adenine-specific DNA methylase